MKRFTDVQTDLSGRVGGFAAVVESKSSLHYVKESVFSVCAAVAVKPLTMGRTNSSSIKQ